MPISLIGFYAVTLLTFAVIKVTADPIWLRGGNRESWIGHYGLGLAKIQKGDYAGGQFELEQALELCLLTQFKAELLNALNPVPAGVLAQSRNDKEMTKVHHSLASLDIMFGRYESAIRHYTKILRYSNANSIARKNLGILLKKQAES